MIQVIEATIKNSEETKGSLHKKMSLAGIGNAAAGAAVAEIAKNIITPNANKPATKKDNDDLKAFLKSRYFLAKKYRKGYSWKTCILRYEAGNIIHM